MDCNKHQENNESSKISGKRAKVKDLEIQKYDEKSHVFPDYSVEGVPLTLGHQFNSWKKGLSAEAGESTLKPLIHEIEYIKKLSCKKINTADKMLKKLFDAEKHFDLSFSKVFESMETATDDLDTLSASLESFTENSVELQDVFESVKGLIEKTTT